MDDRAFAQACARGESAALERFERELGPIIVATARRFGGDDFAQDVAQAVRERLLIAREGEPARISTFTGEGALAGYVQAITVRLSLNRIATSSKNAEFDEESVLELPALDDDPELAVIKQRYHREFKAAFAHALMVLEGESRAALKLYYLDGLGLADLGRLYGWSVPTASRRIAAARTALFDATRKQLSEQLGLNAREVESVLRLLQSRLSADLSD